ncbi:MAG: branched-chain amino acid ABC transporter permease [Cellulomonadaceae bacterium TMED98]|nr:MAG: branched-chain amino acid ABC transporter permease [Cellulomonadaceae bacterium TMED98]
MQITNGGRVDTVAVSSTPLFRKLIIAFIALVLGFGGVAFASPAHADTVGDEYEFQIFGNVKNEGEPLNDVLIQISGNGYSAEVRTDENGQWAIGVPEKGTYEITLVEDTLPEGIAVLEGGPVQTLEWGFTNNVAYNFFIGEGQRTPISTFDQFLMRVFDGLNFGLLLGLAAIGLSLVFGTTALPNFAQGEMVTFGALAVLLFVVLGVPVWLAFPLAVLLSAGFGWAIDAGIFGQLRKRSVGIVQMMIVSIGLSLSIRYVYQFFVGGGTEQLPGASGSPEVPLFRTVTLSVNDLISMGVSLVVIIGVGWWLLNTKMGKATRAVSDNASLAAASGIDVERVIRTVWVLAGGLSGLAGILWAYFRPGLKWDMGEKILLFIFAAGVLGGLGTAFGALVGALIVGVFIETSALFIPSDLKYVGALVIMIAILLFRPQGILGKRERIG